MYDTTKPVTVNRQIFIGFICLMPLLCLLGYMILTTHQAQITPRENASNSRLNDPDGLWEDCASDHAIDQAQCISFMKGYMRAYASLMAGKAPWCLPAEMTWGDLRIHFSQWLPDHPEFSSRMDSVAFQMMLREDFPCAR